MEPSISKIIEKLTLTPLDCLEIKYLTGPTSLNMFLEGRKAPLWHTTYITNTASWSISGVNFSSTSWLLGVEGLIRANESLERAGLSFDFDIYAASYERAVFDLLYEFCVVLDETVPNIQATDIDDVVNFEKVMEWIDRSTPFLKHDQVEKMKNWLKNSDYEFNLGG